MGYYLYYYWYYAITIYYGYKLGYGSYFMINNVYYYLSYPFKDVNIEMIEMKEDEKNNNNWILLKKN
jgi:hypothetical protein